MLDVDRFKLLFGPYRMPRCRVGRTWLHCAIRGQVRVVGISDAPIMWPLCKAGKHLVPIARAGCQDQRGAERSQVGAARQAGTAQGEQGPQGKCEDASINARRTRAGRG
jgi:hypothetical protein